MDSLKLNSPGAQRCCLLSLPLFFFLCLFTPFWFPVSSPVSGCVSPTAWFLPPCPLFLASGFLPLLYLSLCVSMSLLFSVSLSLLSISRLCPGLFPILSQPHPSSVRISASVSSFWPLSSIHLCEPETDSVLPLPLLASLCFPSASLCFYHLLSFFFS